MHFIFFDRFDTYFTGLFPLPPPKGLFVVMVALTCPFTILVNQTPLTFSYAVDNFYMNWGWEGVHNGYYRIDNLTLNLNSGTYNFVDNNQVIIPTP